MLLVVNNGTKNPLSVHVGEVRPENPKKWLYTYILNLLYEKNIN